MAGHLRLSFCLCLPLLLLLLSPAVPAPAPVLLPVPGSSTDWVACRSLSRELMQLLTTLKEPNQILDETLLSEEDPKSRPPRIRCSDACDPSALDTDNTRCLRRILQGLWHYRALLGSELFSAQRQPRLEAALDQLLRLVPEHDRPPQHSLAPINSWQRPLLQRLALQRLQSFAAVMSRVFTHSAS
ncbi:IL23A protein, partial [Tricholaema leucomelas]|nr:IL23A protein [Tricholaema leucomelas]